WVRVRLRECLRPRRGRSRAVQAVTVEDRRGRGPRDRVCERVRRDGAVHGVEHICRRAREPLPPDERPQRVPGVSRLRDERRAVCGRQARKVEAVGVAADADRDRRVRHAGAVRLVAAGAAGARGRGGPEGPGAIGRPPPNRGGTGGPPSPPPAGSSPETLTSPGLYASASARLPACCARTTAPGGGDGKPGSLAVAIRPPRTA